MSLGSNVVAKESPQSPGGSERTIAAISGDHVHGTDSGTPSSAEPTAPARAPRGMSAKAVINTAWRTVGIPFVAIALFLLVWSRLSSGIETSLGKIPGPMAVAAQSEALWLDHLAEREKRVAFYERQEQRNAARL